MVLIIMAVIIVIYDHNQNHHLLVIMAMVNDDEGDVDECSSSLVLTGPTCFIINQPPSPLHCNTNYHRDDHHKYDDVWRWSQVWWHTPKIPTEDLPVGVSSGLSSSSLCCGWWSLPFVSFIVMAMLMLISVIIIIMLKSSWYCSITFCQLGSNHGPKR